MLEGESSLPKPKSAVRWKAHTPAQQAAAANAGSANRENLMDLIDLMDLADLMERTSATGKCAKIPERRNACPLDGVTLGLVAGLPPRASVARPSNFSLETMKV